MNNYPDLSQPIDSTSSYPDLSMPIDSESTNKAPNKESFAYSAAMAVPRIGYDLGASALNEISKAPQLMTELPALFKLPFTHPLDAASQGLAGANELINNIAQAPLSLAQYGANRLNLLPQSVPQTVQKFVPQDTSGAINQLFGQPQYPGESLLRGITRNLPFVTGGMSTIGEGNALAQAPISQSMASGDIAKGLHDTFIGNQSFEDSGKSLANEISQKYSSIKDYLTNQYANIFNKDSSADFPQRDEPTKVNNLPLENSAYLGKFKNYDFPDDNLQNLHDSLLKNGDIQSAHDFQSELGGEIGYLKKQNTNGILDSAGKNLLSTYSDMRNSLKNDIYNSMEHYDPGLGDKYNDVTSDWQRYVIPFQSDKDLKSIAEGKTQNPQSSQIVNIFRNPEENMNQVSSMLSQDAKNKIIQAGMGKNKFQNSADDMINGHNSIYSKGLNSYLSPEDEAQFINLRNTKNLEDTPPAEIPKKYGVRNALVSLGGIGLGAAAESMLSNPNTLLGAYIGRELVSSLRKKINEQKK